MKIARENCIFFRKIYASLVEFCKVILMKLWINKICQQSIVKDLSLPLKYILVINLFIFYARFFILSAKLFQKFSRMVKANTKAKEYYIHIDLCMQVSVSWTKHQQSLGYLTMSEKISQNTYEVMTKIPYT